MEMKHLFFICLSENQKNKRKKNQNRKRNWTWNEDKTEQVNRYKSFSPQVNEKKKRNRIVPKFMRELFFFSFKRIRRNDRHNIYMANAQGRFLHYYFFFFHFEYVDRLYAFSIVHWAVSGAMLKIQRREMEI